MLDIATVNSLVKIAGLLKKFKWGRSIIVTLRTRAILSSAMQLHQNFAHAARDFAIAAQQEGLKQMSPQRLATLIDSCRSVLCQFLEVDESHVHSTIKLIGGGPSTECARNTKVFTIARSSQQYRNPPSKKEHVVGQNSDFSAILGSRDRKVKWGRPYSVFACPDLTKHSEQYDCSRDDWSTFYKTSFVLPLRYQDPATLHLQFFGFLTFDSLSVGLFRGLPNIFEYRDDKFAAYIELLRKSPIMHLAGLLADTLATILYLLIVARPSGEVLHPTISNGIIETPTTTK